MRSRLRTRRLSLMGACLRVCLPGIHSKIKKFGALLADKAFDVQWLIERLQAQGVQIVISQRSNRRRPLAIDGHMYRWRHLIENFFGKLKKFKRIAMCSDKTNASFKTAIYLASAVIQSR